MLEPKALVEASKQEEKLNKKSIVNNLTFIWHYRLCHISLAEIEDFNAIGAPKLQKIQTYPSCMTCKEIKKMSTEPVERKSDMIDECLDRVHIDVMGPTNVKRRVFGHLCGHMFQKICSYLLHYTLQIL